MTWFFVVPRIDRGNPFEAVIVGGGPGGVKPLLGPAVKPRDDILTGRDDIVMGRDDLAFCRTVG